VLKHKSIGNAVQYIEIPPLKCEILKKSEMGRRLSVYGDFLLKRSMVASGKEQFFINWVRQFLSEEVDLKGEKWQASRALQTGR
jgi:hypothetical protein